MTMTVKLTLATVAMSAAVWADIAAASDTAAVRAAVEALGDGGTLKLERRVYRLTAEGARKLFLAPSNNRTGEKNVVFPIVDKKDVTIDGNGATLVFDGDVFPFATLRSRGVTIRNLTVTKPHAVVAGFAVTAADDAGFTVRFASDTCPYEVKDGELVFDVDGRPNSTRDGLMSLHALDKFRVHYLVTEKSEANSRDKDAYPSTYSAVSVEDRGNREVRFTYRDADRGRRLCTKIPYAIGRPLGINLYPRRNIAFFFEDAEGVRLEDVTIRRFGGMGLVAQRSGDLTLSRFRLLPQDAGLASTTADMMQINSCYGKVVIENCEGADSMDDVIDIHGNYMGLARSDGKSAVLKNYRDWGKPTNDDHYGFFPVRAGDTLSFLDGQNRREIARLRVATLASDPKDLSHVTVTFADGGALPASLPAETLVENLTLYPDVTFRNNTFRHYPHLRFSGRGKYLIEGNRLENAMAAMLIHDLRACWYETGPVADMTIRNNVFVDCNAQGGKAFITIGSLGWPSGGHMGRVLLEGNRYEKLKHKRVVFWDTELDDRDAPKADEGVKPRIVSFKDAAEITRRADPRETAVRKLTNAAFARNGRRFDLFWYSDRRSTSLLESDRVTLRLPYRCEKPVWVDMITGRIGEIPAGNIRAEGAETVLTDVPLWDSPVLIADSAVVASLV